MYLAVWFLTYSVSIACTTVAAIAAFRRRDGGAFAVVKAEVSVLLLAFITSVVSFSFRADVDFPQRLIVLWLMQALFFTGVAGVTLTLPPVVYLVAPSAADSMPRVRRVGVVGVRTVVVVLWVVTTGLTVSTESLPSILPVSRSLIMAINGVAQVALFMMFALVSVWAIWRVAIRWKRVSPTVRVFSAIVGTIAVLAFFWVDILYGAYRKNVQGQLLSIFRLLPIYCSVAAILVLQALPRRSHRLPRLDGAPRSHTSPRSTANPDRKTTTTETAQERMSRADFSPREREVALLLAQGHRYRAIADTLHVSLATVQTHVKSIYRKAQVTNKVELSRFCGHGEHGPPPPPMGM